MLFLCHLERNEKFHWERGVRPMIEISLYGRNDIGLVEMRKSVREDTARWAFKQRRARKPTHYFCSNPKPSVKNSRLNDHRALHHLPVLSHAHARLFAPFFAYLLNLERMFYSIDSLAILLVVVIMV